jgi:hypothetical protein
MAQRLIDADALKDDILKSAVMIDDRGIQTGYEIAIELIRRQPTIDAEPVKHGKWILGKCNRCGEHAPFWSMATTYYESNFCPHCGADMRGETNE